MNKTLCDNWNGFSASIPGSGHIRRGLPCQDASAVVTSPRPALIVCDGRGSAPRSQDGAQAAVDAFRSQIAVFDPMLADILDGETEKPEQWMMFSRIMYRTLMQVKLDLSAAQGIPEKEFDFTVAFAVIGSRRIGCFQVGDGAIVLRQNDICLTAFPPDKGEFANQTHFLRENGEAAGKFHAALFSAKENTGVAITSDGPEHLMFKLTDMEPGRIFNQMMTDLHDRNLTRQDLMDYLTRNEWNKDPRGADDRSIAIMAPMSFPQTVQSAAPIVTEAPAAEPPAAKGPATMVTPSPMPETAAVPPAAIVTPSPMPETASAPSISPTQKPMATIQQTARISRPSAKPSIDIFAKPVQTKQPSVTFVCDMRMLRIICSAFCLAICLVAAFGIVMVKLKSTVTATQQAMASEPKATAPEKATVPEATAPEEATEPEATVAKEATEPKATATEEASKPETSMDQKGDESETPPAQDATAVKQEQQPTDPQPTPPLQEAKQIDQSQKPEAQEDVAQPQPSVAPEQPQKQDDATADGHDAKQSAEGEGASVKHPSIQPEFQKQTK